MVSDCSPTSLEGTFLSDICVSVHLLLVMLSATCVERVGEQNKQNSNCKSSIYFILKKFIGPLFNGDQTVDTNLTAPVPARYVQFNPQEPMIAEDNSICMRVGIESCQLGNYLFLSSRVPKTFKQ